MPVAAVAAEDSSAAAVGFWPGLLGAVLEADPLSALLQPQAGPAQIGGQIPVWQAVALYYFAWAALVQGAVGGPEGSESWAQAAPLRKQRLGPEGGAQRQPQMIHCLVVHGFPHLLCGAS